MTCIVGYVDEGVVYIGGDSAAVSDYDITVREDSKVFKKRNLNDEMIFGFTSSFRMGQLIRYSFKIPRHVEGIDDFQYLCTVFIDELKKCFKDNDYATIKDSVVKGGFFLLGYRGNLYMIESDYQVNKSSRHYEALGCGYAFALGAMHQLEERVFSLEHGFDKVTPKIIKALETAAEFSCGVCGPFNIVSI